jgi:hypothetical protein
MVLHDALYCLEGGILTVCSGDVAARAWVSTVTQWIARRPPIARELWPDVEVTGAATSRVVHGPYGACAIHARGWASEQIRGIADGVARPTLAILDDIETPATTSSPAVREKAQLKLLEQLLPVLPNEGGGAVLWLATPVDEDCLSARAQKGQIRGWATSRYRAVLSWPDPSTAPMWAECERLYLDVDGAAASLRARGLPVTPVATQDEQRRIATDYHAAHPEMDAGAVVLDPHRMPILAAYMRRWDIGDEAFEREYQTEPSVRRTGAIFDPARWRRAVVVAPSWSPRVAPTAALVSGQTTSLAAVRMVAYYDPSDGGDAGACAIGGQLPDGRCLLVAAQALPGRMLEQMDPTIAACDVWDADLAAEANMMHDSERAALRARWAAMNRRREGQGRRVLSLTFPATTENKAQRIRSADVPLSTHRAIVGSTCSPALDAQALAWRPDIDGPDDILDAMQRVIERCSGARKATMGGGGGVRV